MSVGLWFYNKVILHLNNRTYDDFYESLINCYEEITEKDISKDLSFEKFLMLIDQNVVGLGFEKHIEDILSVQHLPLFIQLIKMVIFKEENKYLISQYFDLLNTLLLIEENIKKINKFILPKEIEGI